MYKAEQYDNRMNFLYMPYLCDELGERKRRAEMTSEYRMVGLLYVELTMRAMLNICDVDRALIFYPNLLFLFSILYNVNISCCYLSVNICFGAVFISIHFRSYTKSE